MRRMYAHVMPLLSLGLAVALACDREEPGRETIVRPVRYERVYSGATSRVRSFSGTARASIESRLSFKVAGTIERLNVTMGDAVSAGDEIGHLDDDDYRIRVDQTSASLEQAKAQARNAESSYRRTLGLYENNNASRDQLDAARAAKESAEAQVRSLENSLELARLQLSYTRLIAPVTGSIMSAPVEVNENVQAGQTIVTLSAGAEPEVVVGVPEILISQIRDGAPVTVTFDAISGRRFAAVVTEVAIAPSPGSSTFQVTARLEESDPAIRSGMACEVAFEFESAHRDGFLVPPVAVLEDRTGRFVYVVDIGEGDSGTTRRVSVETGELTSDGLEILSGLTDGDIVVTAGVSRITDGQTVRLLAN